MLDERLEASLAIGQRVLGALALGDVGAYEGDAAVIDREGTHVEIATAVLGFVLQPLAAQKRALAEHLGARGTLGEGFLHRAPQQFFARALIEAQRGGVHVYVTPYRQLAARVTLAAQDELDVGRLIEQRAQLTRRGAGLVGGRCLPDLRRDLRELV